MKNRLSGIMSRLNLNAEGKKKQKQKDASIINRLVAYNDCIQFN
jgi:hypothetical protein